MLMGAVVGACVGCGGGRDGVTSEDGTVSRDECSCAQSCCCCCVVSGRGRVGEKKLLGGLLEGSDEWVEDSPGNTGSRTGLTPLLGAYKPPDMRLGNSGLAGGDVYNGGLGAGAGAGNGSGGEGKSMGG